MSDAELDEAIASLRSAIDSAEATLAKLIAQRPASYITPGQATANADARKAKSGRTAKRIRSTVAASLEIGGRWHVVRDKYIAMRGVPRLSCRAECAFPV
jgi:hypothetical protein